MIQTEIPVVKPAFQQTTTNYYFNENSAPKLIE
jgi:hypothetical protein